uniref:5-demethoxyubiquinone hydroxylase, mitochondrial n=1 Tax=Anopheles merus TaxID=30066 RepID=A0A182UNZ1_ANOME
MSSPYMLQLTTRSIHTDAKLLKQRCSKLVDRIIRVDQAGELGANQIYRGQLVILGHTKAGKTIRHMWEQERAHKAAFDRLVNEYRVRPSALQPVWRVAGFALGLGTALLGERASMACTVAVESVIVEHYNDQLRALMCDVPPRCTDKVLLETIRRIRDEEQEHHDTGLEHGAEQAPFYRALTSLIKSGCRTAIKIAEKV